MFVRVKKIGAYEYLYLVENAREGGRHVQRVIKALGRRDEVEARARGGVLERAVTAVAVQPARRQVADDEEVAVAVAVGLDDGLADGLGDALVGVGVGVGVGAAPLPLVSTTTDSAGTDTELPEKLLWVTDGLAAE